MGTAARLWRLGRYWLLWSVLSVVFFTGLLAWVIPPSSSREGEKASNVSAWPDDQAKSFAVAFARSYFDYDPDHPGAYERAIVAYTDSSLESQVVPEWPQHAPRQAVVNVTVSKVVVLARWRALVTVMVATRSEGTTSTRYMVVPVERSKAGGLVVNSLPSLMSAPLRGASEAEDTTALSSADSGPVNDLLERFFEAYLAGDAAGVAAGPALPGAQLGALPTRLELQSVVSVGLTVPAQGKTREVLAVVAATEEKVNYQLTYRLRLIKGDRWYVAEVNAA